MTKKNLVTLVLILFGGFVFGQTSTQDTNPGQLTFSYPLGTNGIKSYDVTNNVSINMLVGLNGGVEGIEVGGLANVNNGNMNGFQAGGLINTTNGNVAGVQTSGLVNLVKGDVTGGQFSGLVNVSSGDATGVQVSGLVNFNKGNAAYFQATGLVNANYGNANGVQVAGLVNSNLNMPKRNEVELVQISGLINQNASVICGTQVSGILNISIDSLTGVQVSLINTGSYVKGVQVGLVNICTKESDVLPIGLFNIVKGGLFEFELSAGDMIYSNLSYKMGVDRFYSIFKIGYTVSSKQSIYTYGVGVGSYLNINEKNKISIELSSNNISDGFFRTNSVNLLNKFDLNYKHYLNENFSFFAGPSFNTYVSQKNTVFENKTLKPFYTISTSSGYNVDVFNWVGINAGVAYRF